MYTYSNPSEFTAHATTMCDTLTKSSISLKGSTEIVAEFFNFGINNILYQRGIFPPESFKREKKYGLALWQTNDKKLVDFMTPFLQQVKVWLTKRELCKLVLVIANVQTGETLERWAFDIDNSVGTDTGGNGAPPKPKEEKKVRQEIGDVMRQITASVTFLPLLECSFDVLIYTRDGGDIPVHWSESDACHVQNAQSVQLRSFNTGQHKVASEVTYKMEDD